MLAKAGFALTAMLLNPVLGSSRDGATSFVIRPHKVKADEVKKVFQRAWNGYYMHAFPHDSLLPREGGHVDDRNGWGATAIDALSTAIIMGESQTVNQILEFVPTIDFTTTTEADSAISLFETNIRYIGGLISGYDLLTGPSKYLVNSNNSAYVDALLHQATTLADSLSVAFDTPTGIPINTVFLNPTRRANVSEQTNGPAGFGTLVLEWTRLSDLTGNKTYAALAQKAEKYLLDATGVPQGYPGLVGLTVNITSGEFTDNLGSWGGGVDSYYEYLIKMYLYDPVEFAHYKDKWVEVADSTIKYLASHPTSRKDLTFLSVYNGENIIPASQHLASFAGGNFILGGTLLNRPDYIDFGLTLADSYFDTYQSTASKIGPEVFRWVAAGNDTLPPAEDADFYAKAGFWATHKDYVLRPETLESLYYAYRVLGDHKYQDMAWEAFAAIRHNCKLGVGFSGLTDVTVSDGGPKDDAQESFFLAETLKYAYLIFAEDADYNFQRMKENKFVFNTEAHPIRVRNG